jgi:hypothetical protein
MLAEQVNQIAEPCLYAGFDVHQCGLVRRIGKLELRARLPQ